MCRAYGARNRYTMFTHSFRCGLTFGIRPSGPCDLEWEALVDFHQALGMSLCMLITTTDY
jgi:hypothetical protein